MRYPTENFTLAQVREAVRAVLTRDGSLSSQFASAAVAKQLGLPETWYGEPFNSRVLRSLDAMVRAGEAVKRPGRGGGSPSLYLSPGKAAERRAAAEDRTAALEETARRWLVVQNRLAAGTGLALGKAYYCSPGVRGLALDQWETLLDEADW